MSNSILSKKSLANTPSKKRRIGILKFFDVDKKFGIVISKYEEDYLKCRKTNNIQAFYINISMCKENFYPKDNELIVFTPIKTNRGVGWVANNAEPLSFNKDSLIFALDKYRGNNSKIKGIDEKGDKYDVNIICQIIDNIESKCRDSDEIITTAFAEYLSSQQSSSVIQELFLDLDLVNRIVRIFKSFSDNNSYSDNPIHKEVANIIKPIETFLYNKDKKGFLKSCPPTFNDVSYVDKIIDALHESIITDTLFVKEWLRNHPDYTIYYHQQVSNCFLMTFCIYCIR